MGWPKPSPRVLWRAIHAYLAAAYPGPADAAAAGMPAATPSAVRARLETLRSTPDDAFYDSPVFERPAPAPPKATAPVDGKDAAAGKDAKDANATPAKYALRLGNRSYPHMKLIVERSPDGSAYLLRADTHDAHVQPRPGSREAAAFAELSRMNREVADAIEQAWEALGLPTFKKFLRDDLLRRKAALAQQPVAPPAATT